MESGGAARILETDALGRLKSAAMGNGLAEYTYNALDNLTGVTQTDATTYGQGNVKQQARQFSYSSLGRLTAATNPESGQVTYDVMYRDLSPRSWRFFSSCYL